mgnify:FL=1
MEFQSRIIKIMHLLKNYIAANKLMSSIVIYFMVSIVFKIGFSTDILISCLWKTLFHFECPGCGLTTAFMKILTLDISSAYDANPLIFIVLSLGIFYIYKDFRKFKIKLKCTYTQHAI